MAIGDDSRFAQFAATVLVHLDAAYSLSHWLLIDRAAAEDAVQEACLKALRAFESRTGPSAKAWFMAIVRNACLDALRSRRRRAVEDEFDEGIHSAAGDSVPTPEALALRASDARWIRAQIARLPVEFREVVVLRELEEMSYREISVVVKVPVGTVMSRLARGRDLLATRIRAESKRSRG